MRTLTTAFFGAALAVSAFALSGAPASAIETHLVVSGSRRQRSDIGGLEPALPPLASLLRGASPHEPLQV